MNATQDYIEQRKAVCQNEWFKEHKAADIGPAEGVTVINWQKPGTWNYGMRFIIHRRWLVVVGDLGEAVYGWGQDITLDFLAQLNFDYFHGKCQASEDGRKFESFDGRVGYRLAQEWLAEADKKDEYRKHVGKITVDACKEDIDQIAREVYDVCGDSEFASMISEWFKVPSCRCIAHFIGLQMAIKQLTATPDANPSSQPAPA